MSRPNQIRIMLVLAFLLTLVAGAIVGAGLTKSIDSRTTETTTTTPPLPGGTQPSTQPHRSDRNWFAERLGLTSKQQEEWAKIWKDSPRDQLRQIGEKERACYQERDREINSIYTSEQVVERERINAEYRAKWEEIRRDRDKAIAALYTPDQVARREKAEKECSIKLVGFRAERERLLQPLMEKSRTLLSEEQRKKWDAMMKGPGPGMGQPPQMGGPDRHRGNNNGPPSNRRGPGTQSSTRPSAPPSAPPTSEAR